MHFYLHSTMFLLIRSGQKIKIALSTFTFHNVSINSSYAEIICFCRFYLHSTMFLLIRLIWIFLNCFHNYLHSTMFLLIQAVASLATVSFLFTFHNVSINSRYLIFLIFPTFSLLFLSILDSICVFPLYSHLKIIIYLLFMPLSMSPVFYFIEHRQFYNFIFLTAYAISFNFLNVYSYFSTYQQTHCNIIKLQLRIIFFILNRL